MRIPPGSKVFLHSGVDNLPSSRPNRPYQPASSCPACLAGSSQPHLPRPPLKDAGPAATTLRQRDDPSGTRREGGHAISSLGTKLRDLEDLWALGTKHATFISVACFSTVPGTVAGRPQLARHPVAATSTQRNSLYPDASHTGQPVPPAGPGRAECTTCRYCPGSTTAQR